MVRPNLIRLFICFSIIADLEAKKFKIKLISISRCEMSGVKIDPTEPVTYETSVKTLNKHTRVIKTNFTIARRAGPLTMSLHLYSVKQKIKDEIFKIEKVDCHNPFSYQLVRLINLKLDNDCMVVPGNYQTQDINLQDFAWVLSKAVIHLGRYEYHIEFYSDKGLAVCNSIVCDIQESK